MDEPWWDDAECSRVEDAVRECFFADDFADKETNKHRFFTAQAVCSSCVCVEECLEYALATGQKYGVWGMHTPADRRNLKRQMSRRPENAERYWDESFVKITIRIESAVNTERAKTPTLAAV